MYDKIHYKKKKKDCHDISFILKASVTAVWELAVKFNMIPLLLLLFCMLYLHYQIL